MTSVKEIVAGMANSSTMYPLTFTINSHILPNSIPFTQTSPKTITKYTLHSTKGVHFLLLQTYFQLPTTKLNLHHNLCI